MKANSLRYSEEIKTAINDKAKKHSILKNYNLTI